jgi:hypothetical protein
MDESGICYLCWQPCDLTKYREHVPPKGCFPKSTQDLVTVCCCQACNHGNTQYDELFRMITTLTPTQSASQRKVWQRVMERTFARGRLKKEIEAMRASLSPVVVGGIQFGKVSVASRPFRRMMIRITKGFLRHYVPQVDYRAFEWQVLMINQFRAMDTAQTMAQQGVLNYHERGEGSHRLLYGVAVDAPHQESGCIFFTMDWRFQ